MPGKRSMLRQPNCRSPRCIALEKTVGNTVTPDEDKSNKVRMLHDFLRR